MSQLERALLRVYESEANTQSGSVPASVNKTNHTRSENIMPTPEPTTAAAGRKPTLHEVQTWRKQGIRIDLPGSQKLDATEIETVEPSAAAPADGLPDLSAEFALAAKNTKAVAEALDRLMARGVGKARPGKGAEKSSQPLPPPTIEIGISDSFSEMSSEVAVSSNIQFVAVPPHQRVAKAPALPAQASAPQFREVPKAAPSATAAPTKIRARRLSQPVWETDAISWPEEVVALLDQSIDRWTAACDSLLGSVRILSLISLGEGCGCTTISTCLAKLLIEQGKRVLLIDQGQGTTSLTVRLGLADSVPMHSGTPVESLYEAAVQVADLPLAILPAGYEQFGELTAEQLQQFAQDWDIVLWDAGAKPNAWSRLGMVDGAMIVRDARGTHDEELERMIPRLEACRVNLVGIADNYWQ